MRWDSQFQFAGYYAAKWQGYYADAGLDVDIRSAITPEGKILGAVKEVADGNADFGIGAADILIGIDQGTSLVLLTSIFQQSAAEFYAKEETVLQSPADLLNLKVARNVNDLIDVELQSMLLAEGINPKKIVPFKHMPGIQPLVDGSVDVIPGYRLSAPFEFEMQGMKVKTLRPISYGIDFYGDTLFTHARMIEQDAKIVERFRQASLKGWQYAFEHSLEIADRISREVPRRSKLESGDLLRFNRYQIQIVKELALYPIVEIGSVNLLRWQQMNALMRKIGAVKNEVDIDKITFDPEKIEQNKRNRTLRFLINAIYLTAGVLLLSLTFIILLKRQVSRATSKILQREVLLRESEEKHMRMIANISDVIAIMDIDGTIRYKSPNIEKCFGWQPEDLVGTDGWQTVHPEDIERLLKEFSTLLDKDNSAATVEYRYKCKDASYKLIELTAVNLTNDPLIRGVLMNYHDITARKQIEKELRESKNFIASVIENIPLMIFLKESTDLRFVLFNRAGEELLGYDRNELLGKNDLDLFPPEQAAHFMVKDRETLDSPTGILDIPEEPINTAKKGQRLLHTKKVCINEGSTKYLLGISEDITERKQAEAEKVELEAQNRQLQKAESLGRMAGAIAHHFNNQLQVVMGNLEMAMDDVPSGADISEILAEAKKAAHKATEVSRRMLIYLGQTTGNHKPIDLSETYRQSLTLLQAAAPKGMTLNADFPSSGPIINADAGQMQQILTNLVTNAWESIADNRGTIGLTVKTVSHEDIPTSKRFPIDWQPQKIDYACLEVSDTGSGIANKDIEKIFDPFFTTKFTGRGLGLPVVMGIVKAHGGGVTVESEQRRGSVFRVFLPVSTEELPIQHDLPAISEELLTGKAEKLSKIEGGGTVLLIEDEDPVRKMTKKMLTRLGYTVLEAKDGAEAVDIFQHHQNEIICVLSDLTMPCMNGWETLAALRKISPDIPVILSSGYDEARVMADDHTEQPNAFLGKPYQLKGLRETISRVLADKKKTFPMVITQH